MIKNYLNTDNLMVISFLSLIIFIAHHLGADTKNVYFAGIALIERVNGLCQALEVLSAQGVQLWGGF